jgi:hypothetical protein
VKERRTEGAQDLGIVFEIAQNGTATATETETSGEMNLVVMSEIVQEM